MTDDPITAKHPTGSHATAEMHRSLAEGLAGRLVEAADAAGCAIRRGANMRAVARRCRACADAFGVWLDPDTGPALTIEHRQDDLRRWRETQEAARELGVR